MIRKYLTQQQFDDLDNKLNSNVDYVIVEKGSPINVSFVTNNITGLDEIYDFAPTPEGSYNITENGEYDVATYASAIVDVPMPEGSYNITENGEYDVTAYASAYVDVPSGGGVWEERYNSLFNDTITYLDSNTIPSGTTKLRDGLCMNNWRLTYIDAPDVTNIGTNAFYKCTGLWSVNLPDVTNIGDNAFERCSHLTSVDLPNVTSIGSNAFERCTSLTYVDLPNVTNIGDNAFVSAHITSVYLPSAITIGTTAFSGCAQLTTVDIGPNITSFMRDVFWGCSSLTSFTCRATTPPSFGFGMFDGIRANLVIYVPAESVDTYKAASGWSKYADKIQAIVEA